MSLHTFSEITFKIEKNLLSLPVEYFFVCSESKQSITFLWMVESIKLS